MSSILEIQNVYRSYRMGFWMKRSEILKDIHFSVRRDSIFGLLGHNGAGKTTLVKLIAGLSDPTKGTVKINGIETYSPEARLRIGYMPERPYFHEHLTGMGLLHFLGTLSGMTREEVEKAAPEVLERVGMSDAKDVELGKYSKGMLQRIGIAQAILHDPDLVLLDEPMSGLDPMGRREMRNLISSLASNGKTIIFTSHLIQDVEAICDDIAILEQGVLFGVGPVSQFLEEDSGNVEIRLKPGHSEKVDQVMKSVLDLGGIDHETLCTRVRLKSDTELNRVIGIFVDSDIPVETVTRLRPTLEDLFMKSRNVGIQGRVNNV